MGETLAWADLEWFCIAIWKASWDVITTHVARRYHKQYPYSVRDLIQGLNWTIPFIIKVDTSDEKTYFGETKSSLYASLS